MRDLLTPEEVEQLKAHLQKLTTLLDVYKDNRAWVELRFEQEVREMRRVIIRKGH